MARGHGKQIVKIKWTCIVGQREVKLNQLQVRKDRRLRNQLQYDKATQHLSYLMLQQQTPTFQGCKKF